MISKQEYDEYKDKMLLILEQAQIVVTEKEKERIEVADFGLNRLNEIGLLVLTYVNTDRCCAKELVLLPGQICPEHRHPGVDGKEETFRCRRGRVELYVDITQETAEVSTELRVPADMQEYFTASHRIVLNPGEQYTLLPDTKHWFRAGGQGCIISEFSTHSSDETDIFTDPRINRTPAVEK